MAISPARKAAFDILLQVEAQAAYASNLLHSHSYSGLSTPDLALTTQIVMGVLRWLPLLDGRIATHLSLDINRLDLAVTTSLRMAAYQLHFLTRVPAFAVANDSVELVKRARKKSAAGLVNAVCRKLALSIPEVPLIGDATTTSGLAEAAAHPQWLVQRWVDRFGLEAAKEICTYDQAPPAPAVRTFSEDADGALARGGLRLAAGHILSSARRVLSGTAANAPLATLQVQDEASQLVAFLVGQGSKILDCCAAPGGKTRILAERNPHAHIAAVELHPQRASLLRTRVTSPQVQVVCADARLIPFSTKFDRVLADVPCSGTGTLARNPEIKNRLSPSDIEDLSQRQTAILAAALGSLASGGQVLYSTCSLEMEENEAVVENCLSRFPGYRLQPLRPVLESLRDNGELVWKDLESLVRGPFLRTIPGVHPCDGFFAALIERE